MRIAIIGAGMAGIACAERLTAAAHTVTLFDKGRGPGGRMSARRAETPYGPTTFDHGAQYFTVRDDGFRARVAQWHAQGLAAPWPAAGSDVWVGTPTMNAPMKAAAAALDVRQAVQLARLDRQADTWCVNGEVFDTLVVATPAENAAPLLDDHDPATAALARANPAAPCWTVMAAFPTRLDAPDVLRGTGPVGWAARNSAKPGRTGPEAWIIQAGPDWSREHLEQTPDQAAAGLMQAFALQFALTLPEGNVTAHRWRYARSGNAHDHVQAGYVWHPETRLGVCGDWLQGPRVEAAWLSGDSLAQAIQG